ncbi:Ger(x)C family spore germination protein [Bacillus sp. 03113]|uniref:Ger(x)C family spore germination protein n=1 Tax=Bacillus sp. 03113 TaxID=2578211 RepID=UPI0011450EF0|nr:Ger(x)C family spore germination protein [Bacillus sp. 03113]
MKPFQFQKIIKIFILLLIISSSFLLTGCWDRKEVNDMALVLGVAIDKYKDKKIELTLQVLIPRSAASGGQQGSGGSGGGGGGGGPIALVRSVVGKNIADATSKLEGKFSRKIFWGHCKMYIIGEKLAKEEGIRRQMDFLLRHPEPRERAYLFVSHGKAADFLDPAPSLELYTGEGIRKLSEKRIGIEITVKDVEQMLTSDTKSALLPYMKMVPSKVGKKGKKAITITDTAIFKKDKMVGNIDEYATRGLLWLRNEIEVSAITVNLKNDEGISVDPIQQTVKLIPKIKKDKWGIIGKIDLEGMITQNETNLDMMNPSVIKRIEKEIEITIKQRINKALNQVQKEMKVDAFGFADAFHRQYPKQWEKEKNRWDEILPQIDVKIDIKAKVLRSGLSTTPAGLTKEEVKEK